MIYYNFLNESTRTILKHAKDLTSKKGQILLKRAKSQKKFGKEAAKNLSKFDRLDKGRPFNIPVSPEMVQLHRGAKESAGKGFLTKYGRHPLDIDIVQTGGKSRIDWMH